MKLSGQNVLVTGGGSGIGLAIARRFLAGGSKVLICGRDVAKLEKAKNELPGLRIHACDVSKREEREALLEWVTKNFSSLNVLVNNAGVQRRFHVVETRESWDALESEIAINFEAPVHLTMLFSEHLATQKDPCIINVTSGLAFAPLALAPVYSATKAAFHSWTLSLRHQLAKTPVRVVEIIPPAVNTDLGGPGLHTFGVPLDEFADGVMARLVEGELEIGYGTAEFVRKASREDLIKVFERMNPK